MPRQQRMPGSLPSLLNHARVRLCPCRKRGVRNNQRRKHRQRLFSKSGVVDGMAYTLYTDGSIEAKLPEGTIKFGSVAELRAHIKSNS